MVDPDRAGGETEEQYQKKLANWRIEKATKLAIKEMRGAPPPIVEHGEQIKKPRKVVQLIYIPNLSPKGGVLCQRLLALCDDGTMWHKWTDNESWSIYWDGIPQY